MRRRPLSLDRQALMPLVLAVLLVGLFAPTASAAPKKPYRVVFSHPSVPAGVTEDAYSITLTNLTQTQQLGSANITAPDEFTLGVTATLRRPDGTVAAGTATVAGDVISLRNLSLPPTESVTVTLSVRMPCVSGSSYQWGFIAKQSNDFSGTPGNDLGPLEGSRISSVTAACVLRFVDEPASTEKNEPIRATPYTPSSAPVSVEALDGSDAPQRLLWFEGSVTMGLAPTSYLGRLDPGGTFATADDGLASFPNLRIDAAGVYNLAATVSGFVGAQSARFTDVDIAEDCDSAKCTAKLSGRQSTSTLTGAAGTATGVVVLSLNIGTDPQCAEYLPPTSDWYEFEATAAREKTIDVDYTRAAMRAFGDPHNALEICYAAPTSFTVKGGGPAGPFDYDGDGPGAGGFIGLLPDCTDFPPPCVTDRSPMGNGAARISFAVPAAQGDPRFH